MFNGDVFKEGNNISELLVGSLLNMLQQKRTGCRKKKINHEETLRNSEKRLEKFHNIKIKAQFHQKLPNT